MRLPVASAIRTILGLNVLSSKKLAKAKYTAKFSKMLLDFGVIEDFDDLVKMVLKERAKKRKEEKKQMAAMA